MTKKFIALAALAALAAAGCGGAADAEPRAESTQSPRPTATAEALPNTDGIGWQNVIAFTSATDDSNWEAARLLVAPGSPLERWIAHTENNELAWAASGWTDDGTDSPVTTFDQDARSTTTTYSDGETVVLTDWQWDEQGLLTSYADANGVRIEDRLWTQSPSAMGAGQTVTLSSAFRTSSGVMVAVIDVTTDTPGAQPGVAVYVGPDGIVRQAQNWATPQIIVPGATNKMSFAFDGAEFGGSIVYSAYHENVGEYGEGADITLTVG